jgi:predicted NBD/HSP70 family sugar kinase
VLAGKPSLALLRQMSDETVLRSLMSARRLTRAELATATGLSKPTVAEAVRRLESGGLVRDTGDRTTGRGGVGTYYGLADDVGVALAVSIAPEGVEVETVDAAGDVLDHIAEPLTRPATPGEVAAVLGEAARAALRGHPARLAVVSAADPVDKTTGELVQLPDAPFLLGEMSPARVLRPVVHGPVSVDNDVNWAARVERVARAESDGTGADFVYLYLGEGLGCAVVTDGEVRRGHRGIAGEIAHVLVCGPEGRAMPITTVFERLELRHAGSTAIDVDRLLTELSDPGDGRLVRTLARALCGVLDAAVAFCDPELIVVAGPWGTCERLRQELAAVFAQQPRSARLAGPVAGPSPSLAGVRAAAVDALREDIVARSR